MSRFRFIISSFLIWRVLLFFPLVIASIMLPYRVGYAYTSIATFATVYFPVTSFFWNAWANFDGLHYLFIAGNGYTNNFGFFPLYPLLIQAVSFLFGTGKPYGNSQFFSAFFIANISFLLSLFVFYKLLNMDYSEKQTKQSIAALLVFPTAFFFASLYSESLFFLLTLLSFYFARKKNWILAGIFASCSTLTRIVGIFLLPALLYEFFKMKRHPGEATTSIGSSQDSIFFLFLPVIALFVYAHNNFVKTGDWLYFIHAQGNFANNRSVNTIVLFPQTIFRYFKILLSVNPIQFEFWISLLELSAFFFCSYFLYIAWKKKVRTSYLLFSVLSFLVPISTGTFTALPRYILVLFPMFIALGLVENKLFRTIYFVASGILLFLLLMFFSKGYFIA